MLLCQAVDDKNMLDHEKQGHTYNVFNLEMYFFCYWSCEAQHRALQLFTTGAVLKATYISVPSIDTHDF